MLDSVIRRGKIRIVCEVVDFYDVVVAVVITVIIFVFIVEDAGLLGCNTVSLGLC